MRSEAVRLMKTTVRLMWPALVLAVAAAHADPPASEAGAPAQGKSGAPRPAAAGSKTTPGKPASSFTPSEKVGADSAVSFPVDI